MPSAKRVRAKSCGQKERYLTGPMAEAAAQRVTVLNHYLGDTHPLKAYRCGFCPWWHIGHVKKWKPSEVEA